MCCCNAASLDLKRRAQTPTRTAPETQQGTLPCPAAPPQSPTPAGLRVFVRATALVVLQLPLAPFPAPDHLQRRAAALALSRCRPATRAARACPSQLPPSAATPLPPPCNSPPPTRHPHSNSPHPLPIRVPPAPSAWCTAASGWQHASRQLAAPACCDFKQDTLPESPLQMSFPSQDLAKQSKFQILLVLFGLHRSKQNIYPSPRHSFQPPHSLCTNLIAAP
eukprot:3364642-Rhodomonas_salina.3